jgi:eukaryotic-like serine/threonine-protein kinase
MAKSSDDRNLLFGVLALQMDFVSREQLVAAMNAWVMAKEKPLGQILAEQNALAADRRALLEALVAEHLKLHGNDPEKSLAAVSSVGTIKDALQQIDDPGLQASLRTMPTVEAPDPYVTVAQSVGAATSSGSRFRIVRPHARGGLGEVFVAQDEELHREVAVKQIQMRHADEPESRIRFVQEAEITGGLEHPGIVPVYGLGTYADGRPYYAMRFIRGDSLKDALERFHGAAGKKRSAAERSLELRSLLGRVIDVCDAIEYAHSRGVLHRDLKPGNIMLGKYGETLVVDWGLAKSVDRPEISGRRGESALRPSTVSGTAPTQMGSAVGTPQFMSPEQAAGRLDQLGPTSDVYSLGATLYCVLTGRAAFEDSDLGLTLRKVERGEFPRPREINKDLPPPLEAICLKAMSLEQADRYPTPRALADDLEHWLADEPVVAYREPAGERLARWTRRNRAWAQAIAAAVLLVAIIAVMAMAFITHSWNEEAAARAAADRSFREARQAVNDYFTQVSENKLLDVPGLQPLRKELLESALKYYQKFLDERGNDPDVQSDVALTWYRVGRIEEEIEKNASAQRDFEHALAIQEAIVKTVGDAAATAALADTYNALGNLAQQTTKLEDARRWFQRARDLRKQLVDARASDPQLRRKLANADNNLATVDARLGNLAVAKQEFALADGERQKLVTEKGHGPDAEQFRRDLAEGRYNFGVLLKEAKEFPAALDSLHRAAEEFQELAKDDPKSIEIRRESEMAQRSAGDVEGKLGHASAALADYEQARQIAEPLARGNPFLVQLQADVAAIATGIGQLKLDAKDMAEAFKQFQRARGILEQLAADDPSVTRYRIDLSNCLDKIVEIQQAAGRLADARDSLSAARGVEQQLVLEMPENIEVQCSFGHTLDQLAVLLWMDGQKAEALAMSQQATAHLRPAYDKSPREKSASFVRYRAALSKNYTNLAIFKRKSGKPAEAAALALEQRKLWPDDAGELYNVAGELALSAAANEEASAQPTAGATTDRRVLVDQTIDVLREAVAAGFNKFDDLQTDQRFKFLAGEPAFQQLLEKRGTPK